MGDDRHQGETIMSEFNEKVYKNLTKEIESLNPKLAKVREEGNFVTYKNLVNAYSEVLRLIEHCEDVMKTESNVAYMDCYMVSEGKMKVVLYKNQNVYAIDNTHCNLKLEDMVKVLSNKLNKKDKIYVDIRGFGISIYDNLKDMGFNVCKLEFINSNIKMF